MRVAVRLTSGALLPVTCDRAERAAELLQRVVLGLGLPSTVQARMGIALGYACLDPNMSLAGNDVAEGDVLVLFTRAP